ncbi:TetR/AcrR family transcriptional regulator [Endozoicomonas arenosclerae]|uniref:TetR/AcrR family transcriptional regulator n=1 Tax=Endozoicomonas arenosclerae TaxID=1633495 RepID=UPI000785A9F9|nr:TetR/AcrR family transcriptional regulator [Endozoicomonas arenosclerae]
MTRTEEKKRNAIRKTVELCSRFGFHGTSMDRITAETGLSKATIYKYFATKENLIACALESYSDLAMENLDRLLSDESLTLHEKLTARFDALRKGVDLGQFHGCYFQLAFSEYAQVNEKISGVCTHYKSSVINRIEQLLKANDIPEAGKKAIKAEMAFNGLLSTLHLSQEPVLIDMAETLYIDIITAQ